MKESSLGKINVDLTPLKSNEVSARANSHAELIRASASAFRPKTPNDSFSSLYKPKRVESRVDEVSSVEVNFTDIIVVLREDL